MTHRDPMYREFEIETLLMNFDEDLLRSGTSPQGDDEDPDEPPVQG